jgi:hypothetical protein
MTSDPFTSHAVPLDEFRRMLDLVAAGSGRRR